MLRKSLLAIVLLLPATLSAQLVETIEVRVTNIDVVVTDSKGQPVAGLTKDDFVVTEGGKEQPISNFYEVQGSVAKNVVGEAPIPETPQATKKEIPENMKRRIIFYVDNLSLNPFNRNRVFKEMKTFVKEVMRPGDEAMIATYNRSMKVRVPFTKDSAMLFTTLDTIAGESAMGQANRSERKQTDPEESIVRQRGTHFRDRRAV